MADPSTPPRATPPRTQAERSSATRAKVLDATIESLLDVGYGRTSTQEVNRRAGVSRGALLHQFPTREALVVAAVRHLVDTRLSELLARPRPADPDISVIVDVFDGPLFYAALELWVAARTDDVLRAAIIPLDRQVNDAIALGAAQLFGDRYTPEQIDLSVELARGLAISRIMRSAAEEHAIIARLLPAWKELLTP